MSEQPKIAQNDPHASYAAYRAEIDGAWRRVMESGRYILGAEVESFEREFAAYVGVAFAVATASGTDALELALRASGVGPGDAVLTVSHTAVATAAAVVRCGARPVFVDIDRATFTMDPNRLDDAIRRHRAAGSSIDSGTLKAVVPVHLYGHPADMPSIRDVANRHALVVVEDCAQSHGAALQSRRTGAWGELAAFSFYPTKNLGAFGDGGMIVTANQLLADNCRSLREYGWDEHRVSQTYGVNSRLDELQAAILRVTLAHLDEANERRGRIAAIYANLLDRARIVTPVTRPRARHVFHQFVIRTPQRDRLHELLRKHGVETAVHYRRAVHQHPAYQSFAPTAGELPESERAAEEVLSLPMFPQLSDAAARHVAQVINTLVTGGQPPA
jgi:dTDP-4-amino-4,6-dideoxygalactose transaminase